MKHTHYVSTEWKVPAPTPWYRKPWSGGLFGRYETPKAKRDVIQNLLNEIAAYRDGWNDSIKQHDVLLERYRALSERFSDLEGLYGRKVSQLEVRIEKLTRDRLWYDLSLYFLGLGSGAVASFLFTWLFWS